METLSNLWHFLFSPSWAQVCSWGLHWHLLPQFSLKSVIILVKTWMFSKHLHINPAYTLWAVKGTTSSMLLRLLKYYPYKAAGECVVSVLSLQCRKGCIFWLKPSFWINVILERQRVVYLFVSENFVFAYHFCHLWDLIFCARFYFPQWDTKGVYDITQS